MNPRELGATILVTLLTSLGQAWADTPPADPLAILYPYEWVANIDKVEFNEPSGAVYHSARRTLFVVGDNGDLCEIQTDGVLVKQKHIGSFDLEGITVDPRTGLLYLAAEGADRILEMDPDSFITRREFPIERQHQGETVIAAGGQGIEGITFVPQEQHPEGGTFYVANQSFDLGNEADLSAVFELAVPLVTSTAAVDSARIVRFFEFGVTDLSGLHYSQAEKSLYVITDSHNALLKVTLSGDVQNAYAFPGAAQEGIALDESGFLYIAQDIGGVIKLRIQAPQ